MPKVGTIKISAKDIDRNYISVNVEVNVSKAGIFTAKIPKDEAEKLRKYLPDMPSESALSGFAADRYDDLERKLRKFLEDTVSCELTEEKEVIRYAIKTACSYCEGDKDDNYEVYPNGNWLPDHLRKNWDKDNRWRNGTHHLSDIFPEPFSVQVYCQVFKKKTYTYRNGKETILYELCSCFDRDLDKGYVSWLKCLTKMGHEQYEKIKEVDATEENAYLFVQLVKFICKANRMIGQLNDPELLLQFVSQNINDNALEFKI